MSRRRLVSIVLACVAFASGCTRSDLQGTYRVEIEFSRSGAPIEGLLIVSSAILDVPPPTEADRALLGDWIDDDLIDANSCFILHSSSKDDSTPKHVQLMGVHIVEEGISLPIDIYRTPSQSLEIVSLEFFANAIGGEVVLHDGGEARVGRIYGFRSGPPAGQRCVDDLQSFRAALRDSLTS